MKKNFIKTIAIAIICTFALSANAFAAETDVPVDVLIARDLTVTYNGVKQDFFDANGKQVFPLANDGTTYLPVRATAGLFSSPITWIGETNTVAPVEPTNPSDDNVIKDIDTKTHDKGRDVYAGYDTSKLSESNKELVGANGFINVKTSETEEFDGYANLFKFNFDTSKDYMTLKIKNNGTTTIAIGYSCVGIDANDVVGGRKTVKPGETVEVFFNRITSIGATYDYISFSPSPVGVLDTPIDVLIYDFMLKDDWK